MADIALQDLKSKLERLGVNVRLEATVHRPLSPPPPPPFAASVRDEAAARNIVGGGASSASPVRRLTPGRARRFTACMALLQ